MRNCNEIFDFLCDLAPLELQADFDNSGFLIGRSNAAVSRVLLALDITEEVISEAIENEVSLIVSHHPLIFHKLRQVRDTDSDDRVLRLAENRIAAICMHTNLDIADGGVNDILLALLGASCEGSLDAYGCGRFGTLPSPVTMASFLKRCKDSLHVDRLRYYDAGRMVQHLAVMGGAGGDSLTDAIKNGCDTYVTADIKYHQFLDAAQMGINLIDADHFCTENPIIPVIAQKLREAFPDVEFLVSEKHHAIIKFY